VAASPRAGLLPALVAAFFALAGAAALAAAPNFPALTGRIVDQAKLISPGERAELEGELTALEMKSGAQLVVATVSSLDGAAIEPYATALFNAWRLGEEKKNNGVLFLVAPNEHKVRIEVGRGLEATLTDEKAKDILTNAVTPRFKAGDFDGGIALGINDIIDILSPDDAQAAPSVK
jgi:uncharacterized protein